MIKKKFYKKIASIALAGCMLFGSIPLTGMTEVLAAEGVAATNPLTTIWKTAEIGTHTDTGSYTYDSAAKTVSIVGAGTKFDKDTGIDDLYYAYFAAKGDLTIQAKITATGTTGHAGIMVRNSQEIGATSAALYADFAKAQYRYGYHLEATSGGASGLNTGVVTLASTDVYVKLVIAGEKATYYVSTKADFSDAGKPKVQPITGLDAKQIGFFATAGNSAVFSDVKITSVNTADGITTNKIVFDSSIGEMIPTFARSTDFGGTYPADTTFTSSADGNILNVSNVRIGTKGDIRSNKGADYLLFPETTADYTVSAQFNMASIDTGTDKQGIAVGQFATTASSIYGDMVQVNKNYVTQHNFTTIGASVNGGDPKTAASAIAVGKDYVMSYQKTNSTSIMKTYDAAGTVLASNEAAPFDITTNAYATLQSGSSVRYGLGFAGVVGQISNITLTDVDGYVVYDQNDYYIAVGVAPVVSTVDSAAVSELRDAINLTWTATEGSGNTSFVVLVSKDGGEYSNAGTSKVGSFSYVPTADGTYKFKVYGKAGDVNSAAAAVESALVTYVAPIAQTALTATGTDKKIDLAWTVVTGATSYDLYKSTTSDGTYTLVKTFGAEELAYADSDVTNEQPYYYYIIAKNDTNTSNKTAIQQALPTSGHTGIYVYEDEAAKFTITSKSNDTLATNKASIAGSVDKAGAVVLEVNDVIINSVAVTAAGTFSFNFDLTQYRNDVDLYFVDANQNITRKTFNYICLEKYDILVDAAYTGTDGELVNGVPTYKTVSAAVVTVPADNAAEKVIFIKNGNYNERVSITSPNVTLLGEDSVNTRIYKSVAMADKTATDMWTRNCMYVDSTADGFMAENLTIENSFAYTNGSDQQADALCIVADQTICSNVRLIGYQDTLLTDSRVKDANGNYEVTHQYFEKCYITGNVDFIYGAGSSVFFDCDIVARYTQYKQDGCFTAGRTYATTGYGYVFIDSRFLAEDGVADGSFRMSRPWGADASATFIACYLTSAIAATGYGDMSGNSYKNARFAEYLSYGPGFAVNNDRPLLSAAQADSLLTPIIETDFEYLLKYDLADYTEVNALLAEVEALIPSNYVDFSAVAAAVAAVVFGLDATQQATVDAMATSISAAISALVKRVVITSTGTIEAKLIAESNSDIVPSDAKLSVVSVVSGSAYEAAQAILKESVKDTGIVAGKEFGQIAIFEINLNTSDGVAITQLDGKVKVSIPVPAGFDLTKTISAFRVETNGSLTQLDTTIVDGMCVFETDHFSTYIIAEVGEAAATVADTTTIPATQTGDTSPVTMYMLIMGISAGSILYVTRRKRIRRV